MCNKWLGIETAPKDGTRVLIWKDGWPCAPAAHWDEIAGEDVSGWGFDDACYVPGALSSGFIGWNEEIADGLMPTHWLPIPPDPRRT